MSASQGCLYFVFGTDIWKFLKTDYISLKYQNPSTQLIINCEKKGEEVFECIFQSVVYYLQMCTDPTCNVK